MSASIIVRLHSRGTSIQYDYAFLRVSVQFVLVGSLAYQYHAGGWTFTPQVLCDSLPPSHFIPALPNFPELLILVDVT